MKISYDIDTRDLTLANLQLQEIKAELAIGDAYASYTGFTQSNSCDCNSVYADRGAIYKIVCENQGNVLR